MTHPATTRTTADPAPATVVFTAPCPHGADVMWRQTYGELPVAGMCVCDGGSTVSRDRITGTGTEEPRRLNDSLAGESATGLPTPRPLSQLEVTPQC